MLYNNFGFPIKPRSDMFGEVSRLMYNYENGGITPGMVESSLWGTAANYTSNPEDAVEMFKMLKDMCFPEYTITEQLRRMQRDGATKVELIRHHRDWCRGNNLSDSLKDCKNFVEDLLGI